MSSRSSTGAPPGEPARLRVLLIRHGQSGNNVLMSESHATYAKARVSDAPLTGVGHFQARATGEWLQKYLAAHAEERFTMYTSAFSRALSTATEIASACGGGIRPCVWTEVCEVGGIFDHVYDESGAVIAYKGVGGLTLSQLRERYPHACLPSEVGGEEAHPGVVADIDESGWWHNPRRETPAEGEVRVRRVMDVLRRRAAKLIPAGGRKSTTEEMEIMPAAGGFDTPTFPGETALAAQPAPVKDVSPELAPYRDAPVPRPSGQREHMAIVCHGDFIDTTLRVLLNSSRKGTDANPPLQFSHYNCAVTWLDFFPDGGLRVVRVNDPGHLTFARLELIAEAGGSLLTGGPS